MPQLSDIIILSCLDQTTPNQTLFKTKQVINDIAHIVNGFVDSVANANPSPPSASSFYNQSGPLIPHLCYPYNSNLQDQPCLPEELSMENASVVWEKYICVASSDGLCMSRERLTPKMYKELVGAVKVSYDLLHYYAPSLLSFRDCDSAIETLRNITSEYCRQVDRRLWIVGGGWLLFMYGVTFTLFAWTLRPSPTVM